jgi:hypothetical protein
MYLRVFSAAALAALLLILSPAASRAGDNDPSNASVVRLAQTDGPMVITPQPNPNGPNGVNPNSLPPGESAYDPRGPGTPYESAPGAGASDAPATQDQGTFSAEEIKEAGHHFFGEVSMDLAKVVEYAFQRAGRPNGYILGEEAGGAIVAGLRYGEGTLYTKDAGNQRVFWQGPSIGYDFGAEGSKTMVLVYDLHSPGEIFTTYAGIDGSAYFIGGVGITFLTRGHLALAPIRSGIGLRLGANVGYLKYTREPTWNPF